MSDIHAFPTIQSILVRDPSGVLYELWRRCGSAVWSRQISPEELTEWLAAHPNWKAVVP